MILNNGATDCQTHSHSRRFGGVKGIKYLFEVLWLDSNTEVLHTNEHLVRFMEARIDQQLSPRFFAGDCRRREAMPKPVNQTCPVVEFIRTLLGLMSL